MAKDIRFDIDSAAVGLDEDGNITLRKSGVNYTVTRNATIYGSSPAWAGEDWFVHPATFDGNPTLSGVNSSIGTTKSRVLQFAGMADRMVMNGTSRWPGNIQWGYPSVEDPLYVGHPLASGATDTPTNQESSASAWLKFRDNTDGTQELAMGRIKKYPDGRLRFLQKLDDEPI